MILFITGATGYLGSKCLDFLIDKNCIIHAVTRNSNIQSNHSIYWHNADILNLNQTRLLIRSIKPTHLLHLAWETEHNIYWDSDKNYDWVEASFRLISEFANCGGKRVVISGSCAEYQNNSMECFEYKSIINPSTLYGKAKYLLYQKLINSNIILSGNVKLTWCRIFSLFGGQENQHRLFPYIVSSIKNNKTLVLKNQYLERDYSYYENICFYLVELLFMNHSGIINLGSGRKICIGELANLIINYLNKDMKLLNHDDLNLPINDSLYANISILNRTNIPLLYEYNESIKLAVDNLI